MLYTIYSYSICGKQTKVVCAIKFTSDRDYLEIAHVLCARDCGVEYGQISDLLDLRETCVCQYLRNVPVSVPGINDMFYGFATLVRSQGILSAVKISLSYVAGRLVGLVRRS